MTLPEPNRAEPDRAKSSDAAPSQAERALIEEAAKKSALLWIRGPQGPSRPLWHVWLDGAVCLVGDGPLEQPLTDLGLAEGGSATVTARSKEKGGRLVVWPVRIVQLAPRTANWEAAVGELKGKRLNAPDSDTIADRWARECRVLRLETAGPPLEQPGAMPTSSHATAPLPTAATTLRGKSPALPRLLLRRRKRKAGRRGDAGHT